MSGAEGQLRAGIRAGTALFCAALLFLGVALPVSAGPAEIKREGVVRWVIDGDTFELANGERVRLIGINTPEHTPWKHRVDFYGKEAAWYARGLLTGKKVLLARDARLRDKYGRTLAYVYMENGDFVNKRLVEEGYARASHYAPNGRYRRVFAEAEQRARQAQKGLWSRRTR